MIIGARPAVGKTSFALNWRSTLPLPVYRRLLLAGDVGQGNCPASDLRLRHDSISDFRMGRISPSSGPISTRPRRPCPSSIF
ncbi:MAG: hypothetical protein ACLTYW_01075 [Collinsella sp.]